MKGIQLTRGVKAINHSQFVNDTLLMGGASIVIALRLNTILAKYLRESRGQVKKGKHNIYRYNYLTQLMGLIA